MLVGLDRDGAIYDADMSWIPTLQWLAIPLLVAYYFALWKKQSAALINESGESWPAGESRLGHTKRVLSSVGFLEWCWLTLITISLGYLIFASVGSLF